MAMKIEKGGWILIFLIGLALVLYSLISMVFSISESGLGSRPGSSGRTSGTLDTSKPLPATGSGESSEVRVRVNIWVGCVPGLVANGGLDTAAGSIYAEKGLKVSFKIIDDWTEGAAALATGNVDVMLTTDDVWAKDYAQFQDKKVWRTRVLHGGLVSRRRWCHWPSGNQQH